MCGRQLKDASCVLLEVEDPSSAENDSEKADRCRRLHFYLKNGLRNTGVRVNTFGVDFLILESEANLRHSTEDIGRIYSRIYRSILPGQLFVRNIHVL